MNVRWLAAAIVLVYLGIPGLGGSNRASGRPTCKVESCARLSGGRSYWSGSGNFFRITERTSTPSGRRRREKIGAIADPAAIPAIVALLKTEKHGQFRRA